MLTRFMAGYSRMSVQATTPAYMLLSCRSPAIYQPSSMMTFAKKTGKKSRSVGKDKEEVEIVSNVYDRNSEVEFRSWLKQDLYSEKKKQVNWNSGKRSVFDKHGYNENHLPH